MTLDKNQFCPCGTGKKIKFCCKDIAKTLDKIARAVEGQQYESAIQQIERANEEYPQRAALWAIKTTVLMQTGQLDLAQQAVDDFLGFAPENPIALSASAMLKIATIPAPAAGDDEAAFRTAQSLALADATATVHRALAHSPDQMPVQVYEAIGVIGQFLIETGHLLAGREHLLFQYAVSPDQAQRGTQLLMETNRSRDVPLLFKQESSLPGPVDWMQWKEEYIAARDLAMRGAWTTAAAKIKSLIETNEPHPVLLQAYAALCGRLPDEAAAAAALRAVVECPETDLDDAIEAEALALLLDEENQGEMVDLLLATMPIANLETALEKLLADRRAETLRMDFASMGTDENPPPKTGFMLLDRPMPASPEGLTAEVIPHAFGECLIYGKQTDRDARLEMICSRPQLEKLKPIMKEMLGDDLKGDVEEKVLNQIPSNVDKMTVKPMFPRETPREFQADYVRDIERRQLFEIWPNLPQPGLEGKSPTEATGDPAFERRLKGAVLNLQVRRGAQIEAEQFDALRKQLNLPEEGTLQLESSEVRRVPLIRLHRLDLAKLSTEDLSICFLRSAQHNMPAVVVKVGKELISRDAVEGGISKSEIYGRMAQNTTDSPQAIEWLQTAQKEAIAINQSPAMWMISEMTYRLIGGQGEEAQALMNKIQSDHMTEPGVAQMLMQTMQQLGLVGPEGMPRQGPGAGPGGPGSPPPAAAPPQQAVWTPDSGSSPEPSQAPPEQGGKSAIWTPGMD